MGSETILLVEDDGGVREYAFGVLQDLGYRVLQAADADAALNILARTERVDLLFTDVVLGGRLNGRRLAETVSELRRDIPVLFTTGYTRDAIVHHGRLDADVHLLTKPYTSSELSVKIRELIESGPTVAWTAKQGHTLR